MRPDGTQPDGERVAGHETDGFDTWVALQKATDKQRANLIADIVGHPEGA